VEFKFHNVSVCSPGCTRDDGGKYEITSDHPIAELTPEIVEWLTTHSKARKQARDTRGLPVAEDFDFEDLMSFFDIEIARTNGIWHTPKGCPVKGDWHHTDNGSIDMGTCAFAWDPEARTLGWKDHAASCAGADMNVKQVIEFLEETKGVYPKEIFVELIDDAEVEWAELEDTETVDAESVFDANKCYILGCKCNKEHVVLPSMAGLLTEEIVSDETQAKIKANTAAAEEQERRTAKRMAEIAAIEASTTQEEESDVPVASTPADSD